MISELNNSKNAGFKHFNLLQIKFQTLSLSEKYFDSDAGNMWW